MSSYIVDRDKLKTLYLHFRDIDNLTIKDHDDYLRNVLSQGASNGPTYIAILSTLDQVANNLFPKQVQNNGVDDSILPTPDSIAGGNTSQPVSREDLFKDVYDVLLGEIKKSLSQYGKYSFETMEGAIHNAIELSNDGRIKIKRLNADKPPYWVPIDILKLLFMKTRDINNLSVTKVGDLIKGMNGGSGNHPTYWAITRKLLELAELVPQVTESNAISEESDVPSISQAVTSNLTFTGCAANNYVLIIDEINRGNVSQIFGELITLIEPDKRAGMPEALDVTLPYSKEKFSVPANLYIIGTMNTADRSVEALDTALRRRFSFREMTPEYDLLKGSEYEGIRLNSLLEKINLRIEGLLDKDHAIGHSYFLKVSKGECTLKAVFFNEIIPLLQEYFYGNFGRIEMVLGSGFVKSSPVSLSVFALPSSDNDDFNDHVCYTLVRSMNDADFLNALHTLMN
ncbi:MAG: AAA family ATPase [Candidatus Cloacimonetes bacterium]|nr:AAA family ATPase [Candidatus Cloacimonadota bacterium]